jgi:ubiquinone/menaquinone biosynthesis C-methylase UbiE
VSAQQLADDFDRIALVSDEGWSHNSQYHPFLLRQLPARIETALELGCGTGAFARLLAARAEQVIGLDLSPAMLRLARERSLDRPNIEYRLADVRQIELPHTCFDCVATIATLHHLPIKETLARMAATLRPGGVLLALDLYAAASPIDTLACAVAFPLSGLLKLSNTRRLHDPEAVRRAWAEHGQHDVYPTLAAVRQACASSLPEARVRRHLLFRYSIVWHRPIHGG